MGRIECGGGKDGEPDLRPLGWQSYVSRVRRVATRSGGDMQASGPNLRQHVPDAEIISGIIEIQTHA